MEVKQNMSNGECRRQKCVFSFFVQICVYLLLSLYVNIVLKARKYVTTLDLYNINNSQKGTQTIPIVDRLTQILNINLKTMAPLVE